MRNFKKIKNKKRFIFSVLVFLKGLVHKLSIVVDKTIKNNGKQRRCVGNKKGIFHED